MRRRRHRILVLGLWVGAVGCSPPVEETGVRAFAVGNHLSVPAASSYESYAAEMRRVVELAAPDFASDRANLVVLAEDIGLTAAFVGSRGAAAREATTAAGAFLQVAAAWEAQATHYQRMADISFNRAVTLALTDPMARAFFETFPALADEYDVYLSACTLLPRLRQSTDAGDIATFADPDVPAPPFVWLPEDENVYNVCYLWDPDGEEVGATRKVNLTPTEIDLLDLSAAPLSEVEGFALPFGTVGIAISLDAFIPSYVEHLDALGVQIVLQNDANSQPWVAYQERSDHLGPPPTDELIWQAEEWEDSTIRMITLPELSNIEYDVCPMMVGNLFDLAFDGQSSITARHPPADNPERAYVGNPRPWPNFVALGPWTFPDPVEADPGLDLEARRAVLQEQGQRLAPGSGDPLEDRYVESVAWADLELRGAD